MDLELVLTVLHYMTALGITFHLLGFFLLLLFCFVCLFVCLHFLSLLGPNSSQAIVSLVACL